MSTLSTQYCASPSEYLVRLRLCMPCGTFSWGGFVTAMQRSFADSLLSQGPLARLLGVRAVIVGVARFALLVAPDRILA